MQILSAANGIVQPANNDIVIRPIRSDDARLLLEMHERLSPDSIYYRYLCAYKPKLSDLQQLTSIHGDKGSVLVATTMNSREKIIGVAYFALLKEQHGENRNQTKSAECAILVEDAYQGQGLGRSLFNSLIQEAIEKKVQMFHADTHPNNRKIMGLIRSTDIPSECKIECGVREVNLRLDQAAVSQTKSVYRGFTFSQA